MDNVSVEEITDGKHKAQVGEEEVLNEIVGDVIVEESTDGKHKAEVREEETVTETAGGVTVEEKTDGEHKAQVREEEAVTKTEGVVNAEEVSDGERLVPVKEEEAVTETAGLAIVEEGTDGEHRTQVMEEKAVTEMVGVVILEEGTVGDHVAHAREEEVLNETVACVIAKESADGKHKAQVGEEDILNETVGDVIVEESTDGEHEAQVGEEDILHETMGDVIVEESTHDEHKAHFGEEEAVLDETMGNVTIEENTDGDHKAQVSKGEAVIMVGGSTDGEHRAQVGKEEPSNRTMTNVIVEESTDGEQKARFEAAAALNETEKQVVQLIASETRVTPEMEDDQYVRYHLPPLYKANFSISDLVWGKVKSHPWWPGQIFDPSDATKLAMKYQKKDSFLIAYFGDKTFAWCDESQLKPFHSYFSQLEKQCSSDTFVKAIRDILMEVSRRLELGMACSCLPEEDYTSIKYQKAENAGIRGGNINSIIDRNTVANYFQPDRLLDYIEALAQFPNGRVDRLEFVIAQTQLKAFYHSKGYPELPIFTVGGGLVESVPKNSPASGKGSVEDVVENCIPGPSDLIYAKELRSEESSFNKEEHGLKDNRKQKSMSKLAEDGTAVYLANGGKHMSAGKSAENPISSSSGKKHLIVESDPVDSGRCKKRMLDSFEDIELKSPSPTVTGSFKIGEFIRRAASQLTGAPPILRSQGETLQKFGPQAEHKKDGVAEFDVFPETPVENQRTNLIFTEDFNSPDEMLSQLCLAARDPMKEYDFVSTIVAFFTGFRNFCLSSSSEDKEHVEKRKRGRPRKVITQQASSDISSSEDEKHVEKHKRGMLKNVISQLASSDISSEEEKPVEKRKRGRPRKNPQPVSSDSSDDKKPVQKRKRGRPRGRPKKDSQLASPDYSSSEKKKPVVTVEKRKRGRPRKVNSEMVHSDISTPDHMKDSYWSDMDLQKKRNGISHIQYQRKRRKSTGEQSPALPSTPMPHEQQLQLVAMNPNMKHTFIAERSIVSVEEKFLDERMPTALFLSFNNANSLPSETDLIRIFSRYGPLKEAETDVLRKTNRAKVVFKRRVDAETAFSSAGKYSVFGPGLLSYQLKPWTPRSTLQATPQGTQDTPSAVTQQDIHDAAPIATPQDNHDAAPIATTQGNGDAMFITIPQNKHDLAPITIAQDNHDLAPITMVQDNRDAAADIILQDKCNAGPTIDSNLELSEHAEALIASDIIQVKAEGKESLPHEHDPAPATAPQENQDVVLIASPLDDLTPTITQENLDAPITMVQENFGAAAVIRLQDQWNAGSNLEFSDQVMDVIASETVHTMQFNESSSPYDRHDQKLIITPQEDQDVIPVASPQDENDFTPTGTQYNMDADSIGAAPITMVQDNHDAGFTVGSNLDLSEQAEGVIASDSKQVEASDKESSLHEKHDGAPIAAPQENQDVVLITLPLDAQHLTSTSTQDNIGAAPIIIVQENHDAATVITLPKCNSELSEDVIVSDTMQVEAEDKETLPQGNHDPPLTATSQQNEDPVSSESPVDDHDLTPTSTEDNLDAASITMVQDNHGAAAIMTLQDKCDAGPTVRSNLELSEQAEDVPAEVKESVPKDNYVPARIAAPEQKKDAEPLAFLLDKHDLTPSTAQENIDVASIYIQQENHGAAPITMPQDNLDAEPTATPRDNHDVVSTANPLDHYDTASIITAQDNAASIATPQDKNDLALSTTAQDCHDLAPITTVQDNPDAGDVIARQEKCDAGQTVGSNLEMSEQTEDVMAADMILVNDHIPEQVEDVMVSDTLQVEAEIGESLPQDSHDPPQLNRDTELIASLLNKDDWTPSTTQGNVEAAPMSMPQGNHDAAPITIPQDNQNAEPIASLPEDYHDVPAIAMPQDNHDAVSITTPAEHHHAASVIAPEDSYDAASIAIPQDKHDLALTTAAQVSHDPAPIAVIENNHNAVAKCDAGPTVGSTFELSGQAEDVTTSDTLQVETEDNESLPEGKQDPEMITIPQQNRDTEPVASLINKHDSIPTTTQDNLDATHMAIAEDNHDAPLTITPQHKYVAGFTEGCNSKVSEEAESGMAKTIQVEAEGGNLEVSEQSATETASATMQVEAEGKKASEKLVKTKRTVNTAEVSDRLLSNQSMSKERESSQSLGEAPH